MPPSDQTALGVKEGHKKVSAFLNTVRGFETKPEDFTDLYTMYKSHGKDIVQVMVLAFFSVADSAVCHLESIAVNEKYRGKGLGTQAVY